MQKRTFHNGGFVLHGIKNPNNPNNNTVRFSAWYDAEGTLLDCEKITRGKSFEVAQKNRAFLETLGKRHA